MIIDVNYIALDNVNYIYIHNLCMFSPVLFDTAEAMPGYPQGKSFITSSRLSLGYCGKQTTNTGSDLQLKSRRRLCLDHPKTRLNNRPRQQQKYPKIPLQGDEWSE